METELVEIDKNQLEKILALNIANIKVWKHYDYTNGFTTETKWDNLSTFERWMHGGPWLDLETLNAHYDLINSNGIILGLKNNNGDIIGEAEFYFQKNYLTGNNSCYLIWFLIHPDHRKQGIGTNFLKECLQKIKKDFPEVVFFETIPEDEKSSGLYHKLKFKKVNEVYNVTINISDFRSTRESGELTDNIPCDFSEIESLHCWSRVFYPVEYTWNWLEKNQRFHQLINSPTYPKTILKKLTIGKDEVYFAYNNRLFFWVPYKKRFNIIFLESVFDNLIRVMKEAYPDKKTFLMDVWYGELQVLRKIGYEIKEIKTSDFLRL